jgi:N-acetylglucosamine-6-sulfatase
MVLKSCKEDSCRDPWRVLHPDDDSVRSLGDALKTDFDAFYSDQIRIEFDSCSKGYLLSAEGTREFNVFEAGDEEDGADKLLEIQIWTLCM